MFKQKKLKKLLDYKGNLEINENQFPKGYMDYHKVEIECIDWLIASYQGRAGKPIEYLEALINDNLNYERYATLMAEYNITPLTEVEKLKERHRRISFLYNWIYYNKITGF